LGLCVQSAMAPPSPDTDHFFFFCRGDTARSSAVRLSPRFRSGVISLLNHFKGDFRTPKFSPLSEPGLGQFWDPVPLVLSEGSYLLNSFACQTRRCEPPLFFFWVFSVCVLYLPFSRVRLGALSPALLMYSSYPAATVLRGPFFSCTPTFSAGQGFDPFVFPETLFFSGSPPLISFFQRM